MTLALPPRAPSTTRTPRPRPAPAVPWLIVAADLVDTGGMDQALLALLRHLLALGGTARAVAHGVDPGVLAYADLVRRPLGRRALGDYALEIAGRRAVALLRARGPARVLVNGGNCPIDADINWAHYVHAAWRPRRDPARALWSADQRARERRAFARAKLVVANSECTARDLVETAGVDPGKVKVRYYGTDPDRLAPPDAEARARTRASLGLRDEDPAVAFVGALDDERKGFDSAIAAWSRLAGRAGGWDATLLVLGRGPLLEHWRREAARRPWGRSVRLLGFRADAPAIIGACDLLISPTRYEPYGLNVHEALCLGVPALVSARAGVAERFGAEKPEWLLPDPDDDADLADRLGAWRDAIGPSKAAARAIGDRLRAWTWSRSFAAPESEGGWGLA